MSITLIIRILYFRVYFQSIGRFFPKNSAKKLIDLFSTPRSRKIREIELEVLKNSSESSISFQGNSVKTYQWGEGKDYVLLSHGWESNAGSLGAFVKPLVESGYKVISFDSPAHGYSGGDKANMIVFKQLALQIIEKNGIPKIAIGHSLGANVLILLAHQNEINIDRVILLSPFNQMNSIFRGFQSILKFPNSLYDEMLKLAEDRIELKLRDLEFGELGSNTRLENILLMHDKNDKITPINHSETMDKQWRQVNFIPIEGSGHYKILWKEEVIDKAKSFIQGL